MLVEHQMEILSNIPDLNVSSTCPINSYARPETCHPCAYRCTSTEVHCCQSYFCSNIWFIGGQEICSDFKSHLHVPRPAIYDHLLLDFYNFTVPDEVDNWQCRWADICLNEQYMKLNNLVSIMHQKQCLYNHIASLSLHTQSRRN